MRFQGGGVDDFSLLLPANSGFDATIPRSARPAAGSFSCAIHPWMRGVVRVFDHPYFAVTDTDGNWEIPHAPAGRYRIVYWHETAGYRGERNGETVIVEGEGVLPEVEFEVSSK